MSMVLFAVAVNESKQKWRGDRSDPFGFAGPSGGAARRGDTPETGGTAHRLPLLLCWSILSFIINPKEEEMAATAASVVFFLSFFANKQKQSSSGGGTEETTTCDSWGCRPSHQSKRTTGRTLFVSRHCLPSKFNFTFLLLSARQGGASNL